jgi:hypothetical protein
VVAETDALSAERDQDAGRWQRYSSMKTFGLNSATGFYTTYFGVDILWLLSFLRNVLIECVV